MTARTSGPDRKHHPGRLAVALHLVRRFFGFLRARPLTPREQSEVAGLLSGSREELFWRQAVPDQRHALEVARRVLALRPGDREAAAAALLHDVGKIGLGLGAVARSVATILDGIGLGLRGRYRSYRNHGGIGAALLEDHGAGRLEVAFAARHPGSPPEDLDPAQWQALIEADRG